MASLPAFDLQTYISRYDPPSETRLQRLLFLAHQFHSSSNNSEHGSDSLASQAFDMAVQRMKESGNHRRYLEEFGAVEATSPSVEDHHPELNSANISSSGSPHRSRSDSHSSSHHHANHSHPSSQPIHAYQTYDPSFPAQSKLTSQSQLETLDARLGTAMSHVNKESIRMALLALGEFHRGRGDLREAWRKVLKSRWDLRGVRVLYPCLVLFISYQGIYWPMNIVCIWYPHPSVTTAWMAISIGMFVSSWLSWVWIWVSDCTVDFVSHFYVVFALH